MIFLLFTAIVITVLIVFKDNKWVHPVATFVNNLFLVFISIVLGGVVGFFGGYLIYGKIMGLSIPLEFVFNGSSTIEMVLLSSMRQNIAISTIFGCVLGLVIYLIAKKMSSTPKDGNMNLFSASDELIKLDELKQKGIITQREFEMQKKKVLRRQ